MYNAIFSITNILYNILYNIKIKNKSINLFWILIYDSKKCIQFLVINLYYYRPVYADDLEKGY